MIDMFEEYGYDLFDNPSLVRDIELQVSEVSCECDGFYICSDHTQQQGVIMGRAACGQGHKKSVTQHGVSA